MTARLDGFIFLETSKMGRANFQPFVRHPWKIFNDCEVVLSDRHGDINWSFEEYWTDVLVLCCQLRRCGICRGVGATRRQAVARATGWQSPLPLCVSGSEVCLRKIRVDQNSSTQLAMGLYLYTSYVTEVMSNHPLLRPRNRSQCYTQPRSGPARFDE